MKKTKLFLALSSLLSLGMVSCGDISTFKVSFSTGEGYTLVGEEKAKKDTSYSFSISFNEGYEATSSFEVKVNGEIIEGENYSYTVANVNSDLDISVAGVAKMTFNVSFLANEGIEFVGESSASYGDSYSFIATKKEGYEGEVKISYFMGEEESKTLTSSSSTYTINNVKGNLVISSSNLDLIEYNVTAPSKNEAYSFTGEAKVKYGQDYIFTLKSNVGYQFSSVSVKENGIAKEVKELNDDQYKVSNVKGDLTIEVIEPGVRYFSINKDFDSTHFDFVGEDRVAYGQDYVFDLKLKDGFKEGSNFTFLVNDDVPVKNNDGHYVVSNVTSIIHIEAFGEEEVKLNVTFSADEEKAITNVNEEIPYFQDNYSFTLNFTSSYSQCEEEVQVYLSVDGNETLLSKDASGVYSLANPHKDFKILVKGCRLNRYTVSFYNKENKVFETSLTDGTKLSKEQLEEAKQAVVATLGENEQFEYFDFDSNLEVKNDLTIQAVVSTKVSALNELKDMESSGAYYLGNDIELEEGLGIESFSGYLNGNGHKLLFKKLLNGSSAFGLFKNFSGVLKNFEINEAFVPYRDNVAGLIQTMNDGLIENVKVNISIAGITYGYDGGFVRDLKGGTIKDSTIHFSSATLNSETDLVGAVVGNVEGGSVENVKVITPKGMDNSNVKIAYKSAEGMEDAVSNCTIETEKTHLLYESPLADGTKTENAYMGMPVYSKPVSTSTGSDSVSLFASDCNVKLMKRSVFYIRSSRYFLLDGGTLQVMANKWTKVEITFLEENKYFITTSDGEVYQGNTRSATLSYQNPDVLNNMLGYYPWAVTNATIECTPIYSEIADLSLTGNKVADAIFTEGELQSDYAHPVYFHSLNAGTNDIVSDLNISSYSTITFGLKSVTNASYAGDFTNDSDKAYTFDVNATGWAVFRLTKNSDATWDVRMYRFDSMSSDRTVSYKGLTSQTATKLTDLFPSISTWVGTGIYSTSIYAK